MDKKTVGVMRVCDEFVDSVDLTVGALAAHCDAVCFLTNHVTRPEVIAAMDRCGNCEGRREYVPVEGERWNHYYSTDQAYRLADSCGAGWVVMQDQDELLPWAQLRGGIEQMERNGSDTLVLPVVHHWGTTRQIVATYLNATGDHAKVYRGGNKGFTVCHGGGFCLPGCAHVKCYWPYPYRHLGFMTHACREVRATVAPGRARDEPWARSEPPVVPYREDWSIQQYNELPHVQHDV
jgi:broad specificity phosphatase PhoE